MRLFIRKQIRHWVPFEVRKQICFWKIKVRDYRKGVEFACAERDDSSIFSPILIHKLPITTSKTYKQKVHNFKLAIEQLEKIVIHPDQVFSFLRVVGEASPQKGYQKSRSLSNDSLVYTYGGGLCQMSALIYQASLRLGLNVVERHNHSVDIYTDETRYMPLGSDAAITYPFKDLRVKNNSRYSLRFRFEIVNSTISLIVESTGPVSEQKISHQVVQREPHKVVHTKNHHDLVVISVYKS